MEKIIFIVGPTAVGKSKAAFLLAQEMGGEIISCDSMQVYKEANLISDKPSPEMCQRIVHHLVDIISVEEEFDVAKFNDLVVDAIHVIHAKNKIPIVVGGSGLYMQILLDGIFPSGEKDDQLRKELRQQAQTKGKAHLYNRLKELDPEAASKIHPNDIKRIIRAMEVCLIEEKPISELQKQRQGLWGQYDISLIGLSRDREKLYEKINARVDDMFENGVVQEVKKLYEFDLSYSAQRILGVPEIQGYLEDLYTIEQAKEMMKQNTRRFAKRQMTWFRKEKRIQWIDVDGEKSAEDIVEKIIKLAHLQRA